MGFSNVDISDGVSKLGSSLGIEKAWLEYC